MKQLPKSYLSGTFTSGHGDGATVRLHFSDAEEAEQWFNGITGEAQPAEQANGGFVGYMNAGQVHELQKNCTSYGYVYADKNTGASVPVYTTPPAQPAREWVGLTEGEQMTMWAGDNPRPTLGKNKVLEFARAIESKLREKNT